jgi:hypothetical protein
VVRGSVGEDIGIEIIAIRPGWPDRLRWLTVSDKNARRWPGIQFARPDRTRCRNGFKIPETAKVAVIVS